MAANNQQRATSNSESRRFPREHSFQLPRQQTLAMAAVIEGRGYFSGEKAVVELRPAPVGTGIVFVRTDCSRPVRIPARVDYRVDDMRRTSLSRDGVRVEMIEHAMAALAALEIDNCEVAVSAEEMPAGDGSASLFVEAIDQAGIRQQDAPAALLEVDRRLRVSHGDSWIEAEPSTTDRWELRYELNYDHAPAIGAQTYSVSLSPDTFRTQLAPARTFLLQQEADWLRAQGLGTHVTHQDLLVFDDHGPVQNRLRFHDECVRHKLMDLIGDLALCGRRLRGSFVAARSGHQLNGALTAKLVACWHAMPDRCSA